MSNPHIKDYASLGGLARASKLSPEEKAIIAKKGSDSRIKKYGLVDRQAVKDHRGLPIPDRDWRTERHILANFILSKGGDPDELIQQALSESGELDQVID